MGEGRDSGQRGRGAQGRGGGVRWTNPAVTATVAAVGSYAACPTDSEQAGGTPPSSPAGEGWRGSSSAGGSWRGAPLLALGAAAAGVRTLLMIVLQTTPPLLLASPEGAVALGAPASMDTSRPAAVATASGWLQNITRGRLLGTPECFLAGTLRHGDAEDRVVVCPLSSVPAGLPDLVVTDVAQIPRGVRRQAMAWVALPALAPSPLYSHAALTIARLATYQRPVTRSDGTVTARAWSVGARPWSRVQTPGWVGERWVADGVARVAAADAADAHLRQTLRDLPRDDPDRAPLTALLDSMQPVDVTELPAAVREGECPDFSDPALARVPFSSRVQPPATEPMPPPEPQVKAEGPAERRLDQMLRPEGVGILTEYLGRYHAWLKWLLMTPNEPGPPRPEVLTLGPNLFYEEVLGHLWGLTENGTYTQVDMLKPIETHLDLSFLTRYQDGFPDQEIFGHLTYGVRLKAPTPWHVVIQPHMVSAIGKFDAIQKELERLQGKGWYQIVSQVPFLPWHAVQQGTAERALEKDRPRRTSNYSAPHEQTHDDVGQEVVPVNVACVRDNPDWAGAQGYAVGLGAPSLPLPQSEQRAPRGVGVHLFAGPSEVSQGFADEARARGWGVLEVDLLSQPAYDLLDDATYHSLLASARAGRIRFLLAGIPCETYSVARWRRSHGSTARPLRVRGESAPRPDLTWQESLAVAKADLLAERTCRLCQEVQAAGGVYAIENPPDRSDGPYSGPFWTSDHAPLWHLPCMRRLRQATGAMMIGFSQCMLGAATQKATNLMVSPALFPHLSWLQAWQCNHRHTPGYPAHADLAVGWDEWWRSRSRRAASYPPVLNASLARGFTEWQGMAGDACPSAPWQVAPPSLPPTGQSKQPPEVKPLVSEAMQDLSVLEHARRPPTSRISSTRLRWHKVRSISVDGLPSHFQDQVRT